MTDNATRGFETPDRTASDSRIVTDGGTDPENEHDDERTVESVLAPLAERYVTVERVLAYHRDDRSRRRVKDADFVATLEHADGAIALAFESNMTEDYVGYHGDGPRAFDAWIYSHVREAMDEEPVETRQMVDAGVREMLIDRKPDLVLREDSELADSDSASDDGTELVTDGGHPPEDGTDEPADRWCDRCKEGPFVGSHGLALHTTLVHGEDVEPRAADAECCSGRVGLAAHDQVYCLDCGLILYDSPSEAPEGVLSESHDDTTIVADGGVTWTDLTGFQGNLLRALAAVERSASTNHGLAVKAELETEYDQEIHHGRLYPNLDDLAEMDLIEKERCAIDDRTNRYGLTDAGRRLLTSRLHDLADAVGAEVPVADGGERA